MTAQHRCEFPRCRSQVRVRKVLVCLDTAGTAWVPVKLCAGHRRIFATKEVTDGR